MTSRLFLVFMLGAIGCSDPREEARPLEQLRQALNQDKNSTEVLAQYLRDHGKTLEPYLSLPGYSGSYLMSPEAYVPITVQGKPYAVIPLRTTSFSIPGDYAQRFILLDGSGLVLDVVTVVWPSRLEDRFTVDMDLAPADGGLLRVLDLHAREFWGNFSPPYYVLREMTDRSTNRSNLSWSGDRILGLIGVEQDRFVAIKR